MNMKNFFENVFGTLKKKYGYFNIHNKKDRINPSNSDNWEEEVQNIYNKKDNKMYYQKFIKYYLDDTNLICLDFDNHNENGLTLEKIYNNFPFLKNCYYTLSKSKKGFHFFITTDEKYLNIPKKINCNGNMDIDFLTDIIEELPETELFGQQLTYLSEEQILKIYPEINKKNIGFNEIPNELQQKIYNFNNEEIIELVNILNPNRADEYDSWYKIVGALKSVNLQDIAREFSMKSTQYDKLQFDNFYQKQKSLSIGIIHNMAKEDNLTKYKKIVYKKTKLNRILEDTELADVYLEKNEDVFFHPSNKHNCIYVYNENKKIWSEVDKENKLNYYIKIDLDKKIKNYINYLEKETSKLICEDSECSGDSSKNESKICEICIKKKNFNICIKNAKTNLKNSKKQATLNQIASSCSDTLRANPTNIEMDPNPYLFCWENNITYDIQNQEFYQRNKNDYITHTCGYDYIKSDINNQNIDNYFNDIFPNEEVKNCYISILRTGLTANRPQKFTCANGGGRNGKGVTSKIMSKLLGNYFFNPPASIITEGWKGSKASPEIANIKNKRLCIIQEPEDKEEAIGINIKKLTGEDILPARKLYSNNTETENNVTYIMECNERLKISGDVTNESMLQRYIDIYFTQTFTSNKQDLNKPNYKPAKPEYSTDTFAENMRIAFFHYLVENAKTEIYEPEIVKERSIQYLNSCEGVTMYFKDNYKHTGNENDIVKVNDIYNEYKFTDDYLNMDKKQKAKVNINYIYNLLSKKYNVYERKQIKGKQYKNIILGYCKIIEESEENYFSD